MPAKKSSVRRSRRSSSRRSCSVRKSSTRRSRRSSHRLNKSVKRTGSRGGRGSRKSHGRRRSNTKFLNIQAKMKKESSQCKSKGKFYIRKGSKYVCVGTEEYKKHMAAYRKWLRDD